MKTIRWQMVMEDGPDAATGPMRTAEDVADYLLRHGHAQRDREAFVVLLLNVKHHVTAAEVVTIGVLDGSLIHPREVFKSAIAGSAAAIIVAHNHPSGDVTPSAEDITVTRRLRDAGALLGIPLLDHVIVSPEGKHISLRSEGVLS
jgi:DNA repair protein RadC